MKKVYQLGEETILQAEEINAFLRAKDYITIFEGKAKYDKLYKLACHKIREEYGFNYVINMCPVFNKETRKNDAVVIKVFEAVNDGTHYSMHYDINKDAYYIEVEDIE